MEIPNEIWNHIFCFVNMQEILQLSITCSRFRSLIDLVLLNKIENIVEFITKQNKINKSSFWYPMISNIAKHRGFIEIDDEPMFIYKQCYNWYLDSMNFDILPDRFLRSSVIQTKKLCLFAVCQRGDELKFVKNQTLEICLQAVRQNSLALQYVKKQTPKICLEAVRWNGCSLLYVKKQTPEICLEAIRQNGCALQYVENQRYEICIEAVRQYGYALQYVKEQANEICLEAVRRNGCSLQYVKKQTNEICLEAVRENGLALKYVKKQTNEICLEAVRQDGYALEFVVKQTQEICLEAIRKNYPSITYVRKPSICMYLNYIIYNLKSHPEIIKNMKEFVISLIFINFITILLLLERNTYHKFK